MSPTDVASAKVAYLSALDKKADITVGMNSSTIVLALAPEVLKAATPNIYMSAASQVFVGAANGVGNEWGFVIRPSQQRLGRHPGRLPDQGSRQEEDRSPVRHRRLR